MRPGGLAGHSAALIGYHGNAAHSGTFPPRITSDLGHAEIEGSEPSPGILQGTTNASEW